MNIKNKISRRHFLNRSAGLGVSFYLLPYGVALADSNKTSETAKTPNFFEPHERVMLGSLCNQIFPNATALGVVMYIETLLTAFDSNPPKIFAGGPYSGRAPSKDGSSPENSFLNFLPLNRVQEAAWKLRIYGSRAVPGGYWNEKVEGHVVGLRNMAKKGLEDATSKGYDLPDWNKTSFDFQKTFKSLVVEACFCAPEYGGNHGMEGWKISHFPGDKQPQGYSLFNETTQTYQEREDFPISTFDAQDEQKMGFFTRSICSLIARFHGGRIYR